MHNMNEINMKSQTQLQFSEARMAEIRELLTHYPDNQSRSALIPVLHMAQSDFDGWLSVPVMDYVASVLNLLPIQVYEVASFYSMFNLKPVGNYLIEVCRTSSCWLCGAEDIIAHLENKLGIKVGQTTPDGMFTLKAVECLGSCGTAPMMQVGADYHENLTIQKVDAILEDFKIENKYSRYC
jgi:NADH-quinone oxidoreductase subunit E